MEAGQVVSADRVEPLREPVALALGENLGEGPGLSGERIQIGTVGQDGLEAELFHLGERVGMPQYPADDGARRWRGRGERDCRETLGAEGGANSLVATGVAEWHDLLPYLPGVGAAMVPAVVQIRLELIQDRGAALPLAVEEVFRGGSVSEELDGAVGRAEPALDRAAAVAVGQQRVNGG
ncbi:hypothetical protein OG257_37160 [Streptomyces sp. NBC_00683]|nr:hypothetical protein [Streptomyces sp. NBC_00683]